MAKKHRTAASLAKMFVAGAGAALSGAWLVKSHSSKAFGEELARGILKVGGTGIVRDPFEKIPVGSEKVSAG
jgi:hypothetical protein